MAQINVGDVAPDFETVDDQNNRVKLSDLRGKRVTWIKGSPANNTHAASFM